MVSQSHGRRAFTACITLLAPDACMFCDALLSYKKGNVWLFLLLYDMHDFVRVALSQQQSQLHSLAGPDPTHG
jgi:hypothetical protein